MAWSATRDVSSTFISQISGQSIYRVPIQEFPCFSIRCLYLFDIYTLKSHRISVWLENSTLLSFCAINCSSMLSSEWYFSSYVSPLFCFAPNMPKIFDFKSEVWKSSVKARNVLIVGAWLIKVLGYYSSSFNLMFIVFDSFLHKSRCPLQLWIFGNWRRSVFLGPAGRDIQSIRLI